MSIREIVTENSLNRSVLSKTSREIDLSNKMDMIIIKDLEDTFKSLSNAKGLAAPQIGYNAKAFVMIDRDNKIHLMINPEIISAVGRTKYDEYCLSYPGKKVRMKRKKVVQVKYTDKSGEIRTEVFTQFDAACVLHEYDHLDGITIANKKK